MKSYHIPILAFLAAMLFAADASALPAGFFARKSKLSEGNWVKVSTTEEGVYEISYEDLRAMGFSDPIFPFSVLRKSGTEAANSINLSRMLQLDSKLFQCD